MFHADHDDWPDYAPAGFASKDRFWPYWLAYAAFWAFIVFALSA